MRLCVAPARLLASLLPPTTVRRRPPALRVSSSIDYLVNRRGDV